jgi:hypothetical protein
MTITICVLGGGLLDEKDAITMAMTMSTISTMESRK